jgi:hypothetical protein
MRWRTRKNRNKNRQCGGSADIVVNLEHSKYYSPFTPACLEGASGAQIRDINKNFIYEYDDDTLKEIMAPTPARERLMGLLNRLSDQLPFDFKLIISESSKCIPNHWETEVAAPASRPRIILFIACRSEGVLMRNNFGPPPKSGKYRFTAGNTQPRKGGVFKNIYYFGFSNLVHLYNGDIYVCEQDYKGDYPKLSCDLPRIQGDMRADCCAAKKNHFTSLFVEGLKTRGCFKLTEEILLNKFAELATTYIGEENLRAGRQPSLDAYNKLLDANAFFKITEGLPCSGVSNPCQIFNPHKEKAIAASEKYNSMIRPNVPANALRRDVRRGYTPWYRAITEKGRNPNTKNAEGSTLLERVIGDENLLWFTEILKKGAKLTDTYLLILLTSPKYAEFVKTFYTLNPHLINKDVKASPEFIQGEYTEPYLRPLSIIALSGDPALIDFMIGKGAKISDEDIVSISNNPELKERLEAIKTQANAYIPIAPPAPQPFIISPSRQKELNRRRNLRRLGVRPTQRKKN